MVDDEMKKRIIKVLNDAVAHGMPLAQIAEKVGVSPQAINNWKARGLISADNAFRLARLRGYNPEWLLTGMGAEKVKVKRSALDVKRLAETIDAIAVLEKKLKADFSNLQRARFINEVYSDNRLQGTEIYSRMAEIIELAQHR